MKWLVKSSLLLLQRLYRVGEFEGIQLADTCRGPEGSQYKRVLVSSLRLLRERDHRRFDRVRRHLAWIVRCRMPFQAMAEYDHATRTCRMAFNDEMLPADPDCCIAWFAAVLVHEATHALLLTHGIPYTGSLRTRAERLCLQEQNRFLKRLRPEIADALNTEFDVSRWQESWKRTKRDILQEMLRVIRE